MPTPRTSEALTEGVRVAATASFMPDDSSPDEGKFVYAYHIVIRNESNTAVKLISRHWIIIDGDGQREEVRDAGVVGQTPTLAPGEQFSYSSRCPLETAWGTMEGEYQMRRENGEMFEARIPRFYLVVPQTVSA